MGFTMNIQCANRTWISSYVYNCIRSVEKQTSYGEHLDTCVHMYGIVCIQSSYISLQHIYTFIQHIYVYIHSVHTYICIYVRTYMYSIVSCRVAAIRSLGLGMFPHLSPLGHDHVALRWPSDRARIFLWSHRLRGSPSHVWFLKGKSSISPWGSIIIQAIRIVHHYIVLIKPHWCPDFGVLASNRAT